MLTMGLRRHFLPTNAQEIRTSRDQDLVLSESKSRGWIIIIRIMKLSPSLLETFSLRYSRRLPSPRLSEHMAVRGEFPNGSSGRAEGRTISQLPRDKCRP